MSFRYQYDDVTPNDNPYFFPEVEMVTAIVVDSDGLCFEVDGIGYELEGDYKEGDIVEGQIIKGKFIPL